MNRRLIIIVIIIIVIFIVVIPFPIPGPDPDPTWLGVNAGILVKGLSALQGGLSIFGLTRNQNQLKG